MHPTTKSVFHRVKTLVLLIIVMWTASASAGQPQDCLIDSNGDGLPLFGNHEYPVGGFYPPNGVGGHPTDVAFGDVNGDGIPDIVSANGATVDMSVLLGVGDGMFQPQIRYAYGPPEPSPTQNGVIAYVELGDLDGDGDLDAVCAYFNGGNPDSPPGSVVSMINMGNGAFQNAGSYQLTRRGLYNMHLDDLNGDDRPDVIATTDGTPGAPTTNAIIEVSLNNGNGLFAPSVVYDVSGADSCVSDIDGDGDIDILVAGGFQSDRFLTILSNNGAGSFTLTQLNIPVGYFFRGIVAGDLDHDSDNDVVLIAYTGSPNWLGLVLRNTGGGVIDPNPYTTFNIPQFFRPIHSPRLRDINQDGHADLLIPNIDALDTGLMVFRGNGDATFQPLLTYKAAGITLGGLDIADVDDDGDMDVLTGGRGNGGFKDTRVVSVLLNDGTGNFLDDDVYSTGESPIDITAADFNGDGFPDVAVLNQASEDISMHLGDGTGALPLFASYPCGGAPGMMATGDVDGDGDIDIVVTIPLQDSVALLINNGIGVFGSPIIYSSGGPEARFLACAHLDDDHAADIVVLNRWRLCLLRSNGNGTLADPAVLFETEDGLNFECPIAVGDLDEDGDVDLAVSQSRNVWILRNDGAGTFAVEAPFHFDYVERPTQLFIADMDDDQNNELVILAAFGYGEALSIVINKDEVMPHIPLLHNERRGRVAVGDIDGQPPLDFVVSNRRLWNITVGLGQAGGTYNYFDVGAGEPGEIAIADLDLDGDTDIIAANSASLSSISVLLNRACDPQPACPADIAGDDGDVDVFDLFELLSNWGTAGPGADLASPSNVVDVFDLFELLSAWGPCPAALAQDTIIQHGAIGRDALTNHSVNKGGRR